MLHFGTLDLADSSIREAQRLPPHLIAAVKILTIHHSISNPSLQSEGPGRFKYKREQIPHTITANPCISFSTKTPIFIFFRPLCYVTVGTFARRGLSSTAKTLRSLSGVRGYEY